MTAHTHFRRRTFAALLGALSLCALVGCKTDKEVKGTGVGRGKDPLFGNLIPRQDLPVPAKTATKGKTDPLFAPTNGGKTTGYADDPERFKGTFIPGKGSTPAALSGWSKDGEGLKLESPGVALIPAGGAEVPPPSVEPLLAELTKFGVAAEDRSLERENGQWVCRASVPNPENRGAKVQFSGAAATPADAVKQVLAQLKR
jgi:hypothetical protein